MTRDQVVNKLSEVFVVMATTEIRGLETEVELSPEDGAPRVCVLNADQTDTVDTVYLGERITALSAEKLSALCRALSVASGCG